MPNYIFQILLKNRDKRTIGENITLLRFWNISTDRQFALGSMYENFFNKEDKTKIYNG